MSLLVTTGQRGDSPQFQPVLEKIRMPRIGPGHPRRRPARVRADKAYGSRANRAYLRRRGISYTIPVVLLHGFPEFWYAWRHQLPALADAGDRVVAPDLPGYNTSDKPPRVRDYQPRLLAQEVADLIAALGAGSATVAGHDWGGTLAWLLAMHHPSGSSGWWSSTRPIPSASARAGPAPASCGAAGTSSPSRRPGCPSGSWRPGTSGGCAGPWVVNRPGRAPSPPKTSTAMWPRPPSPGGPGCRHQLLPGRCARQPLARRRPWVGWSPDPDHLGDQDRYLGRELAEPDPAWVPAVRVERIPRPATGSRPAPPNRSTNAWWTSSSSLSAASWELLDVLAVAAVAYRKADPAPRSTSTTDRAPPSSAVQFRRGRTSRGSERMRTTSAVSIATSVPAPIAIPRSDCASADASFTPYRVRERSARACARGDRARRTPKTVANRAEHIYARINA